MRLPTLLCSVLLFTGCYDSSFGERDRPLEPAPATVTIAELHAAFAETTIPITANVVITGRVSTSDRSRNFYRTFCIEQDGTGLEIMAGLDHLHNDYPEGCLVTVRLKGFAVGKSYGVLQAGRMPGPGSGFTTDYIGSAAALDKVVSRNDTAPQPLTPTVRPIAELKPEMCGSLIRIDGLHYAPEDLAPATWAGYKRFADDNGAEIYTYVRTYADFAGEEVPAGGCALTGILQYDKAGDGRYILKLRDADDCHH